MTAAVLPFRRQDRSPFAGADICRQAGLGIPDEAAGRTSMMTCGTSPTWPGFRSRWP